MKKKNSTKRILCIIALAVALAILLGVLAVAGYYWIGISLLFSRHYESDMIISASPDGQRELVVQEWSCLGGAGADVYIRGPGQGKWYNSWMKVKIGTASGDDYYQPISNGTYYVEWESDRVTIYYYQSLIVENRNDRSTWRGELVYEFE